MTTTEHTFEIHKSAQITTSFSLPLGFPSPEGLKFAERRQLAQAIGKFQQSSVTLENYYGKVLKIRGFIQHPADITDLETGEVRQATRTVFLTEAGDCISSTSLAVNRFVQQLVGIFGAPHMGLWEESIPVAIQPQKTRGGMTTYSLSVVEG